jgi:hypothetical protein
MGRRWRWAVVAAGVAVLAAVPFAVQALPAASSSVSAATLLARIRASADVAYSAYAQSTGGLALPAGTGPFDVADLLGGTSRLRIWQRDREQWRIDSIDATGERDVHHDAQGAWSWNYETGTAARSTSTAAPVRLPRADDLAPANLARRLLSQVGDAHVSRLGDRRIAGRDAAGLRLRVDDPRSTITHLDVWALPGDGLPLRVAVYGSARTAFLSATTYELDLGAPAASTVAFRPSDAVRVEQDPFPDVLSVVNQFGTSRPPASVAGLPRRAEQRLGAVGVYGRGVELLVAIPLSPRLAGDVVPQLRGSPGAVEDAVGIAVGAGPLNVQLGAPVGFGSRWLLVGTVRPSTLRSAVAALPPVRGFGFGR